MKETIIAAAGQRKPLGSCSPVENTSDQPLLKRTACCLWKDFLLKQADHPLAFHRTRSKRPLWHLVHVVLCLLLVGPCLAAPFVMSQTAWAAPHTHLTHASPDQGQLPRPGGQIRWCDQIQPPISSCSYDDQHPKNGCVAQCYHYDPATNSSTLDPAGGTPNNQNEPNFNAPCGDVADHVFGVCPLINMIVAAGKMIGMLFQVLETLVQYDFNGWLTCILSAGAISCPITSGGTPWTFDCPVVHVTATYTSYTYDSPNGPVTTSLGSVTYTTVIDGATNSQETIYQAAIQQPSVDTVNDWLSGDSTADVAKQQVNGPAEEPGHLIYTYYGDTFGRQGMSQLSSLSLGIGLLMIGPLFALAGFQLLMASVRSGREKAIANAMETLGRVLLAGAVVGLAYYVVQFLFDFTNQMNSAVVTLHQEIGYPQTGINGVTAVGFSNPGDTSKSFRGLVMPMALWGCVMDDFIGLMADRLANGASGFIPVIGGILGIAGRVHEIITLVNDIGEFLLLVLSVTIWGQAIARIILINYYIIMAPVAFACWGLPGYLGNQVIKAWFKGLLQLLFMQTLQIFILTTVPTLMPDFGLMKFPHGGDFVNPPLQSFLVQLPPIITTMAAVGAPKVMMGIGPMNTVAKAGAIAGKAVAAAGMAINSMTRK